MAHQICPRKGMLAGVLLALTVTPGVGSAEKADRIQIGTNVQVSESRKDTAHFEVVIAADPKEAKNLVLASMASANFSSAWLRSAGVVSRHDSNAAAAACSAASTSAGPDIGAWTYASPVLGSTTALVRASCAGTYRPPTKFASTCWLPDGPLPACPGPATVPSTTISPR